MKDNQPHIAIEFPDHFQENFESELLSGLENKKLIIKTFRREPRIMAAAEWVFPGLIAAYILKPYFESFLREAGKDHYNHLKTKFHELLKEAKNRKVAKMTSSGIQEDDIKKNPQSLALSIYFQAKTGTIVRLLFNRNLEIDKWIEANDHFMDLVLEHYNDKNLSDPLTDFLNQIDKGTKVLYAVIDTKTNQWIISDNPKTLNKKEKN